jgi:hypothetical protein
MATTYYADIQKLYVAYFNRPADVAGLQYWETVVENAKGSTAAVSAAFAASAEYKAAYAGLNSFQVVNAVYNNLFGHDADVAGLTFWANNLTAGKFTIDQAVTAIAAGAQGTDLATYNNRVAAAQAFTGALDTTQEIVGYNGTAANAAAVSFLNTVGATDASLQAAIAPAALNASVANVVNIGLGALGKTFSLTPGVDAVVGTNYNDTINVLSINATTGAAGSNLNAFDSIDGGAGNDTLNLFVAAGANDTLQGTVTNVETINITGSDVLAVTGGRGQVDASFFAGSQNIALNGAAATDVNNVTNQTVTLNGGGASIGVNYGSSATAGTVALNNAVAATTLTLTGSKLAAATVTGSVKAASSTTAGTVTIVDGSTTDTIKTLNLGLTSAATVNVAGATALTTIAADSSTGGITLAGVSSTVSSISTGAGADTVSLTTAFTSSVTSATVSTGAGNDKITVATTGTGSFTVNAGDGNDSITVAASQLIAGNKIDGGAGTDTLVLGNNAAFAAGDYALINSLVTNVESAEFQNAVTALNASKLAFTTLTFDAAGTVTGVTTQALTAKGNLTATASGDVVDLTNGSTYAGNLAVTETGATSTLTLNADTATVNVKASTSNGVVTTIGGDLQTSLTVNLTNAANASSNATGDNLSSATILVDATTNNTALKSIVLTGAGSVTIDASASQALTSVDASQLGGTIANGTTKGTITGGLTYTGNSAIAETITLGSGHDQVTVNSTYAKMDTIVGFDATQESSTAGMSTVDTLIISQAEISGATANLSINGGAAGAVTKLTLAAADSTLDLAFVHAAAAAGTGVVQFQFGGNTYLFADTNHNGTLDNNDFAVKLVGTVDLTGAFATAPTAS